MRLFSLLLLCLLNTHLQAEEVLSAKEFPLTDFSKHSVPLEEIYSGGPPRDGIKSIDNPTFISIQQAAEFLDEREPVVVVSLGEQVKAYPLRILLYHEIINDELDGQGIFVTHCPLCNTAIVFGSDVQGQRLAFGTTGRVRDSNLIMYDRQTESWWQQFTGDAIIGELTGTLLETVPSQIVSFKQFSENYSHGLVLSQNTGYRRNYGKTPYPGYDKLGGIPFLFKREIDFRLPPLERVLALGDEHISTIYPFSYLTENPLINTQFNDQPILIISQASMVSTMDQKQLRDSKSMLTAAAFSREVGKKILEFKFEGQRIVDVESGSEWNIFGTSTSGSFQGISLKQIDKNVHFAFAWLAFYPNANIIK